MMENGFYFILKAPFVVQHLIFFLTFWSCKKPDLIRKIKLTSNVMTSQPG